MMSITLIARAEKRRIKKAIRKTQDKNYLRRLMAVQMKNRGLSVTEISRHLLAARSSINRWMNWYQESGIEGLQSQKPGQKVTLPYESIQLLLRVLIHIYPSTLGYMRSRWSSELFAQVINKHLGLSVHPSTIRRQLGKLNIRYKRARPTLYIKDPAKSEKVYKIKQVLEECCEKVATFYSDEVDVQLNPKIGFSWQLKGKQEAIPTPGKNKKRYLAGALHSKTGKVIYVESDSKNSQLFTDLLEQVIAHYRRAEKIYLIVDNYIIHKSRHTQVWLQKHPKVKLVFQPVYSPWINKIERLWKQLHETITRNHHEKTLESLMINVRDFMNKASPFPGSNPGLAMVEQV